MCLRPPDSSISVSYTHLDVYKRQVDETHRIKLESVLDYFQDCCTFHSEDVGGGLEFLKGQKRAWLLASWQIVIKEYPKLGEQIRIIANPYAFKNFFGHRNLMLQDEHGKDLVYANSNWIFVNTETGKPVRIPDEVANAYELGEPYPMEYACLLYTSVPYGRF